jgi:POT family proton-dependent oligopeptide transporter
MSDASTAKAHETAAHSAAGQTWFGEPRGLTIIFLTEMWEKFSYYGMRAMLVYYMTRELLLPQHQASLVYGAYTAFVYFTPIVGGQLADRWLGRRRAVIIGASLMALGHFMMTFDVLFYAALTSIALGNGLFLPSLPSQIKGLYDAGDARVKRAYNVYYVGINVGGFIAPVVCGTIGELYGWHYGFALAGVGMLIGLATYLAGTRYLPQSAALAEEARARALPLQQSKQRIFLLAAVMLIVVLLRGAYEQLGNTVAIWAAEGIDRTTTGGFAIPMTWFQSLNSLFVFLLTPFVIALWTRQAKSQREPSSMTKMAIGACIVATAYLMLAAVSADAGAARAGWWWLVLFFAVITTGELYVLPVGLGLFARLAPAGYGATLIAAWYFAAFGGNLLAGAIGSRWKFFGPTQFFLLMAALALVAAAALKLLDRTARREEAAEVSP